MSDDANMSALSGRVPSTADTDGIAADIAWGTVCDQMVAKTMVACKS